MTEFMENIRHNKLTHYAFILIALLTVVMSFAVSSFIYAYADALNSNAVIQLSAEINEDNTVTVTAELTANSGISTLKLTLDYDKTAFTLTGAVKGSALKDLPYTATGTETQSDDFIMTWMNPGSDANDTSKGILVKFTFTVNENAPDGDYTFTFKGKPDYNCMYMTEGAGTLLEEKSKTVIFNPATLTVKSGGIITEDEEEDFTTLLLITGGGVAGAGVIGTAVYFMVKRKRGWKKLSD